MKLDKVKMIYIFLLLQPVLDLITSIMTRYEIGFVSFGVIMRGIFILCMMIYLFFFCNTKYRRVSIAYVFLLILYGLGYFGTKLELLSNMSFLMNDLIYIFKYMYFLMLFVTMWNFYIQYKLEYQKILKIFLIDLCMYIFLIIIPYATNTSFSSYVGNRGQGIVGWFYAANDISNIFIMLFPILIYYLHEKITWWKIVLVILTIFSSLLIGTKVAYFGLLLTLIFGIIYYLFYIKKRWKNLLLLALFLMSSIILGNNSYVIKNIQVRIDKYNYYQQTGTNKKDKNTGIYVHDGDTAASIVILSSRDRLYRQTYDIYKTRNIGEKIFGIGFSNRESVNNKKIEKLVEMDIFDILFHGGICLVILYLVPLGLAVVYFVKYFMKNRLRMDLRGWMLGYIIALGFCSSVVSGHLFSSPSALIYYSLCFILFLEYFSIDRDVVKKKVSFLLLHLGNGGIERATVNTANALAKDYDIELVVAYKLSDQLTYDIDPSIKINYLIDDDIAVQVAKYKKLLKQRQLKKFIMAINQDYLKKGQILKLFRDMFDSCKAVFLKKELMIKYLKKCDSDIIISTRVEYSVLLSKYGNRNSKKIAVEHRHHNNDKKYIKMIRNNYDNINYLVVLTDGLNADYSKFLKSTTQTKVVTIPNIVTKYPKKRATLKTNRIISIGRIVVGKCIDEIVEIAAKCPEFEFIIIGSGDDFERIEALIAERHIDNVKLLGDMANEQAMEYLNESSLFIMTSMTEGLPMVLLEAFSYGVPVVSYLTDSGVSDIVDDKVNGYVIKNRNRQEMIKRLKELMSDETKRKSFGKEAYKKSKKFSSEAIVKKWKGIL